MVRRGSPVRVRKRASRNEAVCKTLGASEEAPRAAMSTRMSTRSDEQVPELGRELLAGLIGVPRSVEKVRIDAERRRRTRVTQLGCDAYRVELQPDDE